MSLLSKLDRLGVWTRICLQITGFVIVAGVGVILGVVLDWPIWYVVALAGAAWGLLFWYVKSWGGLLGPHFFFDLIRLARRPRTRDIRVLYALGLLVGLGLMYYVRSPSQDLGAIFFKSAQSMTTQEGTQFAQMFVFTIIVVQNLAVLVLTPVYVGSAISEEKERRTLELLFTTHLKDREILFGKMFSRLLHLGLVLLGGLPILSLAMLYGGVDFQMILGNFINTGLNLISVGSVSILVSAICARVATSVLIIYGMVLPLGMCLGVFSFSGRTSMLGLAQADMASGPGTLWAALIGFGMFHGMISITCLSVALVVLRSRRMPEGMLPEQAPPFRKLPKKPELPTGKLNDQLHEVTFKLERLYDLPVVGDEPLLWKETHLGSNPLTIAPLFYTGLGLSVAIMLLVLMGKTLDFGVGPMSWIDRSHEAGQITRVLCCVWAAVCVIYVGILSAGSVIRERQQNTLDALCTLPVARAEILRAKWLGSFFRSRSWWLIFTIMVVFGTVTIDLQVSGAMVLLAAAFVHGAFFASLGLVLSVVSRTVLAAYTRLAIFLVILVPGMWVGSETVLPGARTWLAHFFRIGLNPVRTWHALGFSWKDYWAKDDPVGAQFGACLAGLGVYLLGAVALWLIARWRFGLRARKKGPRSA